jgi:hypothetical protein
MPLESSTTFSDGLSKQNDDVLRTFLGATEPPAIDFGPMESVGAEQVSHTTLSASSVSSTTDVKSNAPIPKSAVLPSVLRFTARGTPKLKTKQLFEGTVIEVQKNGFTATLSDKTNPTYPDEEGVFENTEISEEDQPLVRPGSSFYWVIGHETSVGGQTTNVSRILFRRLPAWTSRKLEKIAADTGQLNTLFPAEE